MSILELARVEAERTLADKREKEARELKKRHDAMREKHQQFLKYRQLIEDIERVGGKINPPLRVVNTWGRPVDFDDPLTVSAWIKLGGTTVAVINFEQGHNHVSINSTTVTGTDLDPERFRIRLMRTLGQQYPETFSRAP